MVPNDRTATVATGGWSEDVVAIGSVWFLSIFPLARSHHESVRSVNSRTLQTIEKSINNKKQEKGPVDSDLSSFLLGLRVLRATSQTSA